MKNLTMLIVLAFVAVAAFSLFRTQEIVTQKEKLDDCLALERRLAENPDASPELWLQLDECNAERAARLGLDKPSKSFLGNTKQRPEGALAHYEGLGGLDYFTVFADHIKVKAAMGYPSGESEILFSQVEKVEKAWDMPGTINIIYTSKRNNRLQLSISLFGGSEMIRPEGTRDLDRLYNLIEEQRAAVN